MVELLAPEPGETTEVTVGEPLEVRFQADVTGFYRVVLSGDAGDLTLARGEVERDRPTRVTLDCLELGAGAELRVEVSDGLHPGGQATAQLEPTGQSPVVTAVTPVKGTGGDLITIRGGGFSPDPLPFVRIDGVPATDVAVLSSCEIVARVPSRDRLGPVDVSVDLRDGSDPLVLEDGFRYVGSEPLALTAVVPPTGSIAGGYQVQLVGQAFEEGMVVTFNGVEAPLQAPPSPTVAIVEVPAGAAGPAEIAVRTPDEEVIRGDLFEYVDVVIESVTPSEVPYDVATPVRVSGRNLQSTSSVAFGQNAPIDVAAAEDDGFEVLSPAPSVEVGPLDVTVTTDDFGSVTLSRGLFFRGPVPTLASVNPTRGSSDGGDLVTITGTGLFRNSQVFFGEQLATTEDAEGALAGTLVVRTPAHPAGDADVQVRNPDGNSSNTIVFTFIDPPRILDICPDRANPGEPFEVSGKNFAANALLAVNGSMVKASQPEAGLLVGTVPSALPASVTVTNPDDGVSTTLENGLRGNELANLEVVQFQRQGIRFIYRITGSGFAPGVQVRFNDDVGTVDDPDVIQDYEISGSISRHAGSTASQVQVCYAQESCSTFTPQRICSGFIDLP